MEKKWYKSLAVWGALLLFIGGGAEAIGISGALGILTKLAGLLGIPMTGIGLRRAMK